eukprot:766599-Hanusia_phi.AAC.3
MEEALEQDRRGSFSERVRRVCQREILGRAQRQVPLVRFRHALTPSLASQGAREKQQEFEAFWRDFQKRWLCLLQHEGEAERGGAGREAGGKKISCHAN